MVFYAGMGNPGSFGGMGGNPSAFATPGLNPTYLAMLQQMQQNPGTAGMGGMNPAPTFPAGGGAPSGIGGAATNQLANLLPRVGQPGAMPGGAMPAGAGAMPGQAGAGMMGGLNPQMLALLQALGQGGQGGGMGNLGLLGQLGLAGTGAGSAPPPNQGLLGGFFNR